MLWAKTKRLNRILQATESLISDGKKWQSAVKIDPTLYSRSQGVQTGQATIRLGIDPGTASAFSGLVQALSSRSALRSLALLNNNRSEDITLHPWTEGINMESARWGGAYTEHIPDRMLAAPLDGEAWKNLANDPIVGRAAFAETGKIIKRVQTQQKEPLLLPLYTSVLSDSIALPEKWLGVDNGPLVWMFREALSCYLRNRSGGDASAVLMAEVVTTGYVETAPIQLPESVLEVIRPDIGSWRMRATTPATLLDLWLEKLQKLPNDVIDMAFEDHLKDMAVEASLDALLSRTSPIELESADLWRSEAGSVNSLAIMGILEKVDPAAYEKVQQHIQENSGRFLKTKQRRQSGVNHLAKMALLRTFDLWFAEFAKENSAVLEVSNEDQARLSEEAARGGLYVFGEHEALEHVRVPADSTSETEEYVFKTGHLFADLKGFTALTSQLHESEIRQFLRQNFYEPLLRIAKDYFKGGTDLADRGGIRLNNLLGDAISLCGDPNDLLRFSERATTFVQDGIGEIVSKAATNHAARIDADHRRELEEELHQLKLQKSRGGDLAELNAQMQKVQQQLDGIGSTDQDSIELDFGFFVSFGAAPVDLTIQDDVFGEVYVALADKINESARGVERNSEVWEGLSRFEQRNSGKPWAFRIHVGPTISGQIPEALLDAWPTDPEETQMIAKATAGDIGFDGSTSMYNVGIGLSPETLREVLMSRPNPDIVYWQGKTDDLLQRLDKPYLIPEPRQTYFLVDWDGEKRIIRRCGKVAMKGFRRPPTVWEWVGPWMDVYTSLAHFISTQGETMPWSDALKKCA